MSRNEYERAGFHHITRTSSEHEPLKLAAATTSSQGHIYKPACVCGCVFVECDLVRVLLTQTKKKFLIN